MGALAGECTVLHSTVVYSTLDCTSYCTSHYTCQAMFDTKELWHVRLLIIACQNSNPCSILSIQVGQQLVTPFMLVIIGISIMG